VRKARKKMSSNLLQSITNLLPEVRRPERTPSLKEKLAWTGAALLIFFVLGQIYPIGVDPAGITRFERLEILLGSRTGTIITAGIGPIVLASIFLQLAAGAKLFKFDLHTPEGKKAFQGLQKLLAIALSFFEAGIYVVSNYIPAAGALHGSTVAPLLGSVLFTQIVLIIQLALGSILLLYLDELVQKYGIGSGISLFIAAGVTQAIFVGSLSIATVGEMPAGLVPQAIYFLLGGDVATAIWSLVPILFTIIVFLVVVYVEGMKIELPLAYGQARGLGARYPIKFLYVSNIPVILAAAVLLNIQLLGMFVANAGFPLLGHYANNQPIDGIAYFTTALPSPLLTPGGYPAYLQLYFTNLKEILHIIVYGVALVIFCVIFGWFWIETTGMSAKDVAAQLSRTGLQVPGFRQDPRVMEKILERYIPVITILGSIFVGVLAWFADITGALGTGTGILLTVGIIYRFYEDLAQQQLFEMYPALRKIVG
jgi:preprotein translocase subunit SecY